jgi:hypothetical protein
MIFVTFFVVWVFGNDTTKTKNEIIQLGNFNENIVRLSIFRDGQDDVLSCPTIEWIKKDKKGEEKLIERIKIKEICGVLNIVDIGKSNYKDSIVVEMTLARIGVMAYGRMVIKEKHQYKIDIKESKP